MLDTFIALCIGLGLAASCGFRVFVPMLVISIAARTGVLSLSDGFGWLATWPAVMAFALATVVEIGAYYVPWLDNLLDSISTPAAVIAGALAAAACVTEMDPLVRWSVVAISGGGVAGLIKLGTVGLRATSTVTTGGLGNPVVSTIEWISV